MTQTIGYWCDECRVKYVRHTCKNRTLPCGHVFDAALRVYAKAYGRGFESVSIGEASFLVQSKRHMPELAIMPGGRYFWDHVAVFDQGEPVVLGELLKERGAKFVRAFEGRWQSCQQPPDWVLLLTVEPVTMADVGDDRRRCDHPWHGNPGLITACPGCGAEV